MEWEYRQNRKIRRGKTKKEEELTGEVSKKVMGILNDQKEYKTKKMEGKTYCKAVALPSILHGINIIDRSKKDITTLQRIENWAYRNILEATTYAQKRQQLGGKQEP